jgi:hypothetical protein
MKLNSFIPFCFSGLGYRPMIHLNSPLIRYKWDQGEGVTYKDYVTAVKKFLGGILNIHVMGSKVNHLGLCYFSSAHYVYIIR